MTPTREQLDEYALKHTTPLPSHLNDLVAFTRANMRGAGMLSGPVEGTLLQFLVWATGARRILEAGCFTGFSAQMMAAALPEDGTIITCEIDPDTAAIAQEHFDRGPNGHKIELRVGPAIDTMRSLEGPFDLVFIDADKKPYADYYERAMELISDRGLIVVDNVLWGGSVLDPQSESAQTMADFNARVANDERVTQVILTVRDGVMLIRKV